MHDTAVLDLEEMGEHGDVTFSYLLFWPTCSSSRLGWWVLRECLLEFGAKTKR